ncbi:CvpA family protein [Marilutibacter alkalisoli]|uniref:CvpA family protein n=1 Tax=Marilutibacter alkalisoli TaxID=2591633 RepID=A0A514BQ56_9GAMM|nr:CvpA family protein [Lysobacter alkalisoli]QDH69528.1 CvpA family protein [Lysobacter alkalisoli]
MVTVKLLSWFVRRVLDSVGLSGLDRSLGLAIGVVRGGLFACMLVLLMGFTSLPRGPQWQQSLTMPAFEPGARWMRGMLPDAVARQIDFDAGGPLSKDNIQQQKKALQPLIDGSGMPGMPGGQDSQELLRRLGELSGQGAKPGAANGGAPMQTQQLPLPDLGDLGELLQGQNLPLPGTQSQAPTQQSAGRAVDPANVNADRTPDPAAVDGGH